VQGPEHPDTLAAVTSQVAIFITRGQMEEAEALGTGLVESCTRILGREDVATVRAMANLATLYG
jgi:hypothetical protein